MAVARKPAVMALGVLLVDFSNTLSSRPPEKALNPLSIYSIPRRKSAMPPKIVLISGYNPKRNKAPNNKSMIIGDKKLLYILCINILPVSPSVSCFFYGSFHFLSDYYTLIPHQVNTKILKNV